MPTTAITTRDGQRHYEVRDGMVFRNGQAVGSYAEFKACRPESTDTVEDWENRKRRQIMILG